MFHQLLFAPMPFFFSPRASAALLIGAPPSEGPFPEKFQAGRACSGLHDSGRGGAVVRRPRRLTRSFCGAFCHRNVPQTHAVVPSGTTPPSAPLTPAPHNLRPGHARPASSILIREEPILGVSQFFPFPDIGFSGAGAPMGPWVGPVGSKTPLNAPKGPHPGPISAAGTTLDWLGQTGLLSQTTHHVISMVDQPDAHRQEGVGVPRGMVESGCIPYALLHYQSAIQ